MMAAEAAALGLYVSRSGYSYAPLTNTETSDSIAR